MNLINKIDKNYEEWTLLKQKINNRNFKRVNFHEREIWLCSLGENVGFEQDGKGESFLRPVLVIRKFNQEIFLAIPLTSKQKDLVYYYNFSFKEGIKSSAILSQIRLIDSKRLSNIIGYAGKQDFLNIKKKLKELIP